MIKKEVKGSLVAVGGGESSDITEDSLKIIEKFLELSGGLNKARIIVMTVATDNPKGARQRYEEVFDRLNSKIMKSLISRIEVNLLMNQS